MKGGGSIAAVVLVAAANTNGQRSPKQTDQFQAPEAAGATRKGGSMTASEIVQRLGDIERELNRMSRRTIRDPYPLHKRPEPLKPRIRREYRPPAGRRLPC